MMGDSWAEFEKEILDIGDMFKELGKDPYDAVPPKRITEDLEKIDKVLTIALQGLMPLKLQYREDQNILTEPYNYPVVTALDHSRFIQGKPDLPCYPAAFIDALIELRDTAKHAAKLAKPGRGNSPTRISASARKNYLAKNFVFRFRSRFGHMPPISKDGAVINLFTQMLEASGEKHDEAIDMAYEILRRAIENDPVRRLLPSAQAATKQKRPK